jgi:hypothetical protein
VRDREQNGPKRIGVALDAFARIPDQSEPRGQVSRVAKRNVRVVLEESEAPGERDRDAPKGDREPEKRGFRRAARCCSLQRDGATCTAEARRPGGKNLP